MDGGAVLEPHHGWLRVAVGRTVQGDLVSHLAYCGLWLSSEHGPLGVPQGVGFLDCECGLLGHLALVGLAAVLPGMATFSISKAPDGRRVIRESGSSG